MIGDIKAEEIQQSEEGLEELKWSEHVYDIIKS